MGEEEIQGKIETIQISTQLRSDLEPRKLAVTQTLGKKTPVTVGVKISQRKSPSYIIWGMKDNLDAKIQQ